MMLEKAIIGCILGTAVGDALGLSEKFLASQRTKTLVRQPKGIPDSGSEKASDYGFFMRHIAFLV